MHDNSSLFQYATTVHLTVVAVFFVFYCCAVDVTFGSAGGSGVNGFRFFGGNTRGWIGRRKCWCRFSMGLEDCCRFFFIDFRKSAFDWWEKAMSSRLAWSEGVPPLSDLSKKLPLRLFDWSEEVPLPLLVRSEEVLLLLSIDRRKCCSRVCDLNLGESVAAAL